VEPDLCDTTGHCVAPPAAGSPGGCGCRVGQDAPRSQAALAGLAASLLALCAGRRRRRTPGA
jgi:MYXO-CTERM domain-containing protein